MNKAYSAISIALVLGLSACSDDSLEQKASEAAAKTEYIAGQAAPTPAAAPAAAEKAAPAAEDAVTNDALVPGTEYHATGTIPCVMGGGQPTKQCSFGVKRKGNGTGIVTVTKPDGRTRTIFFENGNATGADMSEADPNAFSAAKQDDLNIVLVGNERYEIPDAVIFGG